MFVEALFAGKPRPFGPRQSPSSIIKQPFTELNVMHDGAVEDEQGNKKLHGGPEMAMHQFAQESYAILKKQFPAIASKLVLGSIGENISAADMSDTTVFIGDVYRIGEVVLEVNSPRAPCSKINQRYAEKNIDLFIAEHGITGWYYRVIETGKMCIGDKFELQHRLSRTCSIKEIMRLVRNKDVASIEKVEAASINGMAKEWVNKLTK